MWQLDFISNSKTKFHVVQRQLYSREREKQRKRERDREIERERFLSDNTQAFASGYTESRN